MKNFCYAWLLGMILQGCSATAVVYGVPEPEWQRMSVEQQQEAMRQFQRQELINTQTRSAVDKAREEARRLSEKCQTKDMMSLPECQVKTRRRIGF